MVIGVLPNTSPVYIVNELSEEQPEVSAHKDGVVGDGSIVVHVSRVAMRLSRVEERVHEDIKV